MATETIETVTIKSNDRKTGEMRKFHVVVVQRHSNVQKSVMLVQSYCFADLNLWLFLPFSFSWLSSLLKLSFISNIFDTISGAQMYR